MRRLLLLFGLLAYAGPGPFLHAQDSQSPVFPGKTWTERAPAELGLNTGKLQSARDYALTGGGSGMIVRGGYAVLRWGDQAQRYDLKSSTKSLGATLLGVALLDGRMKLDDPAIRYHPSLGVPPESNRQTGWIEKITLRHLVTQGEMLGLRLLSLHNLRFVLDLTARARAAIEHGTFSTFRDAALARLAGPPEEE